MNREDQALSLSESQLDAGDVDLGVFSHPPAQPRQDASLSATSTALIVVLPSGRSPGRTKFAEPSNDRVMRFIHCLSGRPSFTSCAPFCCAAFREHKRITGPCFSPTLGGVRGRAG
jgi:hypothetical protein